MTISKIKDIGIDIIDKRRIDINDFALLKRVFSVREFEIFNKLETSKTKISFFASRWTAKEAIFKSMNIDNVLFTEIEVLHDHNNKPFCSSHKNIVFSTTHSEFYTITIALKLK